MSCVGVGLIFICQGTVLQGVILLPGRPSERNVTSMDRRPASMDQVSWSGPISGLLAVDWTLDSVS